MSLKHLLLPFLFLASLAQMPFASACAQEPEVPFLVPVRIDRGKVPMAFRVDRSQQSLAVGYEQYNKPAVPIGTKGEVFVPDSITTPDGRRLPVRWISRGSFQGCQSITKVHLPRGIKSISDLAFHNCKSLREITLSDSLKNIYPQAFAGCNALRRIVLKSPHPPRTNFEGTFEESCFGTTTIVIPFGSVDNYRNKDYIFSRFRYHAELIPTFPSEEPTDLTISQFDN